MKVEIGINAEKRKTIAKALSVFLADTYLLFLKTQNFHWNMTSPQFFSYHVLLQKQYEDMFEAVDEIAERIRALGYTSPGSFKAFLKLTNLKESEKPPSYTVMVKNLISDHEFISREGKKIISLSQDRADDVTADMIIKRLAFHEKQAWLLRSHGK